MLSVIVPCQLLCPCPLSHSRKTCGTTMKKGCSDFSHLTHTHNTHKYVCAHTKEHKLTQTASNPKEQKKHSHSVSKNLHFQRNPTSKHIVSRCQQRITCMHHIIPTTHSKYNYALLWIQGVKRFHTSYYTTLSPKRYQIFPTMNHF